MQKTINRIFAFYKIVAIRIVLIIIGKYKIRGILLKYKKLITSCIRNIVFIAASTYYMEFKVMVISVGVGRWM